MEGDVKLLYDLIPPEVLREVAKAFTVGSQRYKNELVEGLLEENSGVPDVKYRNATIRHYEDFRMGVKKDKDGFHPLAGSIASQMILMLRDLRKQKQTLGGITSETKLRTKFDKTQTQNTET